MGSPVDIGIDLGTTFSVLAVNGKVEFVGDYPPGIYLEECDVTIIPTPFGEETFPSVVVEDPAADGVLLFGSEAVQSAEDGQDPVMFSKRKIGTREGIPLGSRTMTAKEVATAFLGYLKECAELALGVPVRRAVVTHPAYFDRAAVDETREAAVAAGFDMEQAEQMVMEPVAAALAYTRSDTRDPLRVLTYDLGGGTFDVTFLERRGGVIEMLAFDGNHLLGGYNFDRLLVHWILERLTARGRSIVLDEESAEDRSRIARLLQLAERVKLSLAEAREDSTPIPVRGRYVLSDTSGKDVPIDERITRADFVALIQSFLERTIDHSREALVKADLTAEEVDEILLVGGSSRGPWITDILSQAFPGASCRLFQPDLCVASGAAIHAKMVLPPLVQTDLCSLEMSLDVPETISIDSVRIQGTLTNSEVLLASLTVRLENRGPGTESSTSVSEEGAFSFPCEELEDEGENRFRLTVLDADQKVLIDHPLSIFFEPLTSETATVMSVLPRALAVETVDGMVVIAKAGATLPVVCEQSFLRQNNNPNITLKLFQDHTSIGQIRVENIPPEGGAGSLVEIAVEVTDSGRIQGRAVVRSPEGEEVLAADISIRITPPDVPDRESLAAKLASTRQEWQALTLTDDRRVRELEHIVLSRLDQIEKSFSQVPLERQEIAVALEDLDLILNPPSDGMEPSFPEFLQCIQRSREAIETLESAAVEIEREMVSAEQGTAEAKVGHKKISQRRHKARRLFDSLQALEVKGAEAHANRDHRNWARVQDAVISLGWTAREHERTESKAPPGLLSKLRIFMSTDELISRLNSAAEKLKRRGVFEDWQVEIRRILAGLQRVKSDAAAIGDDLPDETISSRSQQLEINMIRPLRRRIENLGMDISLAGADTGDRARSSSLVADASQIGADETMDGKTTRALLDAGHTSLFEAVVDENTAIDHQDEDGHTSLMVAAGRGDCDLIRALVGRGADLEARNELGRTALTLAKDVGATRVLLELGADPTSGDGKKVTALMVVAHRGSTEQVSALLDGGAEIDAQWEGGHTALMLALLEGQVNTARVLVERGADVDVQCEAGRSALHYAAEAGQIETVSRLLDDGMDINQRDNGGCTPLFLAAVKDQADSVQILVSRGADTTIVRSLDKSTPLSASCHYGLESVVPLLVAATPNLESRDKDGDTALSNAAFCGNTHFINLLVEHGCQLDARNDAGQTALMVAAYEGKIKAVRCMLRHGLDPDLTDAEGRTARDYAEAADRDDVVSLLTRD